MTISQSVRVCSHEESVTRLRSELQRARMTLDLVTDAIVSTDRHGIIDNLNDAATRLLGCSEGRARGKSIDQVVSLHSLETRARLANPVHRCLRRGRPILRSGGSLLAVPGQTPVPVRERVVPVRDADGVLVGAVLVLHDLSTESGLTEQLRWRRCHDALTGLVNREEFERRLRVAVDRLVSQRAGHTLLYLDLDRFRTINDTASHRVGDRFLQEVARLLQEHVRNSDLCARLGDDEFAVLLHNCPPDYGVRLANRVRAGVDGHRLTYRQRTYHSTVSIGVVAVDSGANVDSLLAAADVACYDAKAAGRNAVSLYSAEQAPAGFRDMKWVQRLGRACDEDQFRLFCQPIVPLSDTPDDARPHYELLLRIQGDDGEIVGPTDFMPAAERFNMMPSIDRWVLRHTLANLCCRSSEGDVAAYTLAVNLSGASLSDQSFLDFAMDALQRAKLARQALCFEITETSAIENIAAVVRFMRELRQLGCEFSLDDFGSGLSSFAYLKELPVDYLKIDGRFVRNLNTDEIDHTMVGAISQIGAAIGVRTVAERVEDAATVVHLRRLGIDYAQGYLFSRPVPATGREFLRQFAAQVTVP